MVHTRNGLQFLSESDIIACKANGNYSVLFLKNGLQFTISKKLKDIEKELTKELFSRIHHSHIINLGHLESMKNGNEMKVTMSDGSEYEISKRKKSEFMMLFKRL